MGITVSNAGGDAAFVLFTGLSILPQRLTLGDCLTRGCAALYLRLRSRAFRTWLTRIETTHLLTWALRFGLLIVAIRTQHARGAMLAIGGALLLGLTLHFVSKETVV